MPGHRDTLRAAKQTGNDTPKMATESRNPAPSSLVLASGSASRKALLARLGLPFDTDPADIDETPKPGESPRDLVERLARAKAETVAARHPDALVIGSDQVAVHDGEATSKPGTAARARTMLQRYSGGEVTFLTAVCLVRRRTDCVDAFMDETVVAFRTLGAEEIARYVAEDDPRQCAGCFKIEALGPTLFRGVRSTDPTALPGLPLIRLAEGLRAQGMRLP